MLSEMTKSTLFYLKYWDTSHISITDFSAVLIRLLRFENTVLPGQAV